MNINRHNYESFFMLYIDKELSNEEKQAVDLFIEENPDLKSELEQLKLSVLPTEIFSFENKEQLFKKDILTEADEENLLLLLDGELSAKEAFILEEKIASQPALAKEWKLLKRTRLDGKAEEVIFENKELLYRKEEKVRPLYFMIRWAAAAAVIGIGFYAGYQLLQKEETNLPPAVANIKSEINNNTVKNDNDSLVAVNSNNSSASIPGSENSKSVAKNSEENITPAKTIKKKEDKLENNKNLRPENYNQALEKQSVLLASNNNNLKIKNYEIVDADPELITKLPAKRPEIVDVNIMDVQQDKNVLRTAFNGNNNGDKILYMDKEVVEKTKVGKFLKKLKSTLSRDIEIESGRTIKIAGFEIARQ